MTYFTFCDTLVQKENNLNFEWYYGQTFIDSDVKALVIEITNGDGDLVDFALSPYNWVLA